MDMRLGPYYPVHFAIFIRDKDGNVLKNQQGEPVKSEENDLIETVEYICIDRCLYVEKTSGKLVQIRTVRNDTTKWNPYNDEYMKVKFCTKSHVVAEFPNQRQIAEDTMNARTMMILQQDVFSGEHVNGKWAPPKTKFFQVRIKEIVGDYLHLEVV